MTNFIEMKDILKIFPPKLVALDDVSITFEEGEIHAIVGENGAGKSTLMKILYGMQAADKGEIYLKGNKVKFNDPGEAIAAGIGMVHQEILLISEFTVWENVVVGKEPLKFLGHLDKKLARAQVKAKIDEFNLNLDPDAKVADLSVAARQKVEILKLLFRNVSVLILDEPTSVLTPQEVPMLFDELRRLRDNGHTIMFISHHLEEVLKLSDRVTVLRKGQKVGTIETIETTKPELAKMMIGRDVIFEAIRKMHPTGDVLFETKNLNYIDPNNKPCLEDINLVVKAGEIVGVAGVEGNGQLELVNVIMGLFKPQSGVIYAQDVEITNSEILERRSRIAFVTQDRANMGACISATITENAIMTHHRLNQRFTNYRGLVLNFHHAEQFTMAIRKMFDVQMSSGQAVFNLLSGGNQQKVILGRELMLEAPFILLDQPTRGLDVGSIDYVHRKIIAMRAKNRGVLLISADLEELFRLSDRLVVMHRGKIVADVRTEATSVTDIGYMMLEGRPYEA